MSSRPPSGSSLKAFTQRKRIYVACIHCRKRKVRCVISSPNPQCERCTKKGLECEYLPVCVQQERALFETGYDWEDGSPSPPQSVTQPCANNQSLPPDYGCPSWTKPTAYGHSAFVPPGPSPFYPGPGFPVSQPGSVASPIAHANWPPAHPNIHNNGLITSYNDTPNTDPSHTAPYNYRTSATQVPQPFLASSFGEHNSSSLPSSAYQAQYE
ncbi:hypothetical protein B0H19DRAFT_1077928 [Mycena capillaripes]|nr:hypothetical protein B0H19DRAFT_1077928 [Mycena capillaripes]